MEVWNNPNVQNVGNRAKSTMGDFEKFILRGNVVDLAVGIVIGAAFTAVVSGFVADFITPLIGVFGKIPLSTLTWKVNNSTFLVGAFINAVITFLITALVVFFFVVKPVNALTAMHKSKTPDAPATRDCPYCLSSVPLMATRCAYCTSPLPPPNIMPPSPQMPQARQT
jgi:large conductance mechanosensitive channel